MALGRIHHHLSYVVRLMADHPVDYGNIARIVSHIRDIGTITECVSAPDRKTLSAALSLVKEAEASRNSFDRETQRHGAEVLLQGFLAATDGCGAAAIHLHAVRIFVREALRRLVMAREQ